MVRSAQKPNEVQRAFNAKLPGARKNGLRAVWQIASQRRFVYDPKPPTCLTCGYPRDLIRGLKCSTCEGKD